MRNLVLFVIVCIGCASGEGPGMSEDSNGNGARRGNSPIGEMKNQEPVETMRLQGPDAGTATMGTAGTGGMAVMMPDAGSTSGPEAGGTAGAGGAGGTQAANGPLELGEWCKVVLVEDGSNTTYRDAHELCKSGVCAAGVCCNTKCDVASGCFTCSQTSEPGYPAGTCKQKPTGEVCQVQAQCVGTDGGGKSFQPAWVCSAIGTCIEKVPVQCGNYNCSYTQVTQRDGSFKSVITGCNTTCTKDHECSSQTLKCVSGVCRTRCIYDADCRYIGTQKCNTGGYCE